jgi:hypothetical protein
LLVAEYASALSDWMCNIIGREILSRKGNMALVLKPSASPEKVLEYAIVEFETILPQGRLARLQKTKTDFVPDATAVMVLTAQLDAASRSRRGRSIASRLHSALKPVREFSAIIDTLVSSNAEFAVLVWGSVKITIDVRFKMPICLYCCD